MISGNFIGYDGRRRRLTSPPIFHFSVCRRYHDAAALKASIENTPVDFVVFWALYENI